MNSYFKKSKKYLLGFTLAATSFSVLNVVACAPGSTSQNAKGYDFGLTSEPLNNLNYIKFKSVDKILPSLVDSFMKSGPSDSLKSILKTNKFTMTMTNVGTDHTTSNFDEFYKKNVENFRSKDGKGNITGSYYTLDDFGFIGGTGAPVLSDISNASTIYAFRNPKNSNNYMAFSGYMNKGKNVWSNGDVITAQDLRDYFEYILDLNTGSQKLETIKKYSIRGAEQFITAQKEYALKHNVSYKNPWGRRGYVEDAWGKSYIQDPNQEVWTSQVPGDEAEVEAIKQAALSFGFYTGQYFLDYTNEEIAESNNLPENFNRSIDLNAETQTWAIKRNNVVKEVTLVKNPYLNPYQEFALEEATSDDWAAFNEYYKEKQAADPETPALSEEQKAQMKLSHSKIVGKLKTLSLDSYSFTMIFDENKTPDLNFLVGQIIENIYPANRKYIETDGGGIQNYGSDPKKVLTSGPFVIEPGDIVLGPQGYIVLTKNKDYFEAANTVSNKIKIFFSTDRNINATLFEDGYISQTYIPANKINSYWSNPVYKDYLNKNSGYGTIAYAFNLDQETKGTSWLQDEDLRNAIYYAIDREKVLKSVGWDFSFPVTTWTAYGQYRLFDGRNLEYYFEGEEIKTKNGVTVPIQNYDFLVHLSKSFNFEKTYRKDDSYLPKTAQDYLARFKAKHPELDKVTIQFVNNSTDEQKKAGSYLREALRQAFGSYVQLEIKSLPENTFAAFLDEGKWDIVYQNFDRLGGNGAQDYVYVFFKEDEIDTFTQKSTGFETNPSGGYTYANYLSELILNAYKASGQESSKYNIVQPYFSFIEKQVREYAKANSIDFDSIANSDAYFDKTSFISNNIDAIMDLINQNKAQEANLNEKALSKRFVANAIEYLLSKNLFGIQLSRIQKAINLYFASTLTSEQIQELTNSTRDRLLIKDERLWNKFIELAYQKADESLTDYSARLDSFFTGNFTDKEVEEKWDTQLIFSFIATLEKIIRDGAFVVPLMEVDTNWEITRVGGVNSLFTFSLQYAYDYTNPPRPGLPRKKG